MAPKKPLKKPAARKPTVKKAKTVSGLRSDLYVYNEATAFVVANAMLAGSGSTPDGADWKKAVRAGGLLPIELVQDDSFVLRLVVGGELTAAEADEWVGRIAWKLRLPEGKLAVAGGTELIAEPLDEGTGRDYLRSLDALREVDVPPGDYRAELFAYVHGVNGPWHLERAAQRGEKEPVGTWWRRTRARTRPSAWLRRWLRADPSGDPGHEAEWARLANEPLGEYPEEVDFLLRLTPLGDEKLKAPALTDGIVPLSAFEARKPERCPLGLDARDLVQNAPAPLAAPRPVPTVDVLARVADRRLAPIEGGPVAHPIDRLFQIFRLAYLASASADPELRLGLPAGSSFAPRWSDVKGIAAAPIGGGLRVGFEHTAGRWDQLDALQAVSERLRALPDGAVVELLAAPEPTEGQPRDLGVQRWRGPVRGGVWSLSEAYPPVDAALLREALALSADVDAGESVKLRDAAEGEKALDLSKDDRVLFRKNPLVVKDGRLGLTRKDQGLLHWVAAYVLRTRWSHVWPSRVVSDEERRQRDEAERRRKALADAEAKAHEQRAKTGDPAALVFKGKVSEYFKVDLLKEHPLEEKLVTPSDRQMGELGFAHLGDLALSRFPGIVARGYAKAGDTFAQYLMAPMRSSFDYFTHWGSAGFTTTLNEGGGDDEPKGVYVARHPELNFYLLKDLHEKHAARKALLVAKLGAPLPVEATLEGFAKALDRGLARQMGL